MPDGMIRLLCHSGGLQGPNELFVGRVVCPCFLKEIFIHERIDVKPFERTSKAAEVVATVFECSLYAFAYFLEFGIVTGIATEVAEIAPQIWLSVRRHIS